MSGLYNHESQNFGALTTNRIIEETHNYISAHIEDGLKRSKRSIY
jgi:hypothetical protein